MALPSDVQGGTLLPSGNYRLPNQDTPNWVANPMAVMYYSPSKGLYYNLINGAPSYHSPARGGEGVPGGRGFFRGAPEWETSSGTWKTPTNWGNLLSLGVGAAIGAPFLAGAFGAGGAGATAGGTGAAATTSAGVLPSTAIGSGMMSGIAGGTGMGATGAGMGIGSGFLSLLKKYGSEVATNLLGKGTDAMSPAGAVGHAAGSIEQQRAAALVQAARLQQEQDRLALERARVGQTGADTELAQRHEGIAAPGKLAGTSVRGDILANAQDANITNLPPGVHMGSVTGGLRPSILSADSRQLGSNMSRQALADQMSGKYTDFKPLPDVPGATPLPSSTGFDKGLQGTALVGGFLNALKGVQAPQMAGATDQPPPTNQGPSPTYGPVDITQPPGGPAIAGLDPTLMKWLQEHGTVPA